MLKFYLAIVACTFSVFAAEENSGEEKFRQFFTIQYELEEGDDTNFANALKVFGAEESAIIQSKAVNPTVVLTHLNDEYNLQIGEGISQTFSLDIPKDENLFGLQTKCTFHAEDEKTLLQTFEKDGKELKLKWDFSAEGLKCEVTCDGVTANRVYKKKPAGEEKLSQFFTIQYHLEKGDDINFAKALKVFGAEESTIVQCKAANPNVVLTYSNDEYNLQIADGISQTFTFDSPKDENLFGLQMKCTFHAEDEDTLLQTFEKDGKELKLKWDFTAGGLKCEVSCDGVTANRVYKKKSTKTPAL